MTDPRVTEMMTRARRDIFLPDEARGEAHLDAPIPIGEGQTNSAPHMVSIMAEALDVQPGHRVLEVGGGSGWHAAVLALLAAPGGRVVTIERHASLAHAARRNLAEAGVDVEVFVGDGSLGLPERAPFDRISVAAAAPAIPPPLLDQLAPGGILLVPVGGPDEQELLQATKGKDGAVAVRALMPVRFVPLVGRHGFDA